MHELHESKLRIDRLHNPVEAWKEIAGRVLDPARLLVPECRLRRRADQEIDLNDEGNINQARIGWEMESNQIAQAMREDSWSQIVLVCKGDPYDNTQLTCRRDAMAAVKVI